MYVYAQRASGTSLVMRKERRVPKRYGQSFDEESRVFRALTQSDSLFSGVEFPGPRGISQKFRLTDS